MRQFEEVLINELKMQEEERVILKHTAETVKQVSVNNIMFFCCMLTVCCTACGMTCSSAIAFDMILFMKYNTTLCATYFLEHNVLFKTLSFVNPLCFVLYNSLFFIFANRKWPRKVRCFAQRWRWPDNKPCLQRDRCVVLLFFIIVVVFVPRCLMVQRVSCL